MGHDPKKHHRRSIRLKGYDYTRAGLYFITICTQNREHFFGHIENGKMILNDAGRMIEKWYDELENKYPDKICHEMVVMPNHFHCIIENNPLNQNTPDNPDMDAHDMDVHDMDAHDMDAHVGAPLRGRQTGSKYGPNNKKYHATIGDAVNWFETMTTNEYIRGVKNYGWKRFDRKLWQRNYYEHIIRNEKSFERISEYIINNPAKWDQDLFK